MTLEPHDNLPEGRKDRNDIEPAEPLTNPGLPEHLPRPTDVYPEAEKRAERQVAGMFGLATLLALAFCVFYFAVPKDAVINILGLNWLALNTALGLSLALSLMLIGIGAIQWAKKLMYDHEVVEMRHQVASSIEDREEALAIVRQGISESGFGRRPLIRNSLLGALGVLGLPAIVLLRDLGPLPGNTQRNTVWKAGMRVVNDISGTPLKVSDLEVGQLVNAEPSILFETDKDGELVIEGAAALQARAKAAVIVVRMRPDDIHPRKGQENWGVDGILCFSKICTHVGCPISLWEQQTHHLLCPCHQSTFDLADGGRVIFGPAHRWLPQLPLDVDASGFLIAVSDFREVVGASYPEIGRDQKALNKKYAKDT